MCLIKFSEKVESYNLIFISSIYLFDRNHCKMDAKRSHKYPISYLHIHQNHSNSVPLPYFTQQLEKRKLVTVRLNCISLSLFLPRAIRRGEIFGWVQIMARHITPFCKRGGLEKSQLTMQFILSLSLSISISGHHIVAMWVRQVMS